MIFFIYIYIEKKTKHWWIRKPENKKEVTLKQKKKTGCFSEYPFLSFSFNSNSNRELFENTKKQNVSKNWLC